MEPTKNYFIKKYENLCNYLEKETVGTEVAIYGASGIMLLVAFIKRRPTYLVRQFKKPQHIPEKIINERIMHTGLIKDVQQRGTDTFLLINHRPLIPFFMSSNRVLPVKLPGVRVNGNGFSWLQSCLVGRQATFLPLNKEHAKDFVVCQLCLVHPPKGSRLLDVSETLLKLRFAKFMQDAAASVKRNTNYYKHLKKVEEQTLYKESWLNWFARHPWLWNTLHALKAKMLPKQKLLPELVR